jgi:hypothetical protein
MARTIGRSKKCTHALAVPRPIRHTLWQHRLMSWLASNAVALTALGISAVTASIQIANWHRGRHRVTLHARSSTIAGGPGEAPVNHTYVMLTVRNTGRAISVENVQFEVSEGADAGQGASWSTAPSGVTALVPYEPLPTVFTPGVLLPDGGSRNWVLSLHGPSDAEWPGPSTQFVATVELSNGKTIHSEPFWHHQTPSEGWVVADFRGP